ncbi:MAG TPA: DUF1972 domain-containing protein [Tenuifilaceae bacterium]|nr:DUF1972 domain-containing protein [Tenuifilaceae bacterium]HPI45098.1 DUF1972 domain-containing protein [Tenuifilaceae bacterium]HPN20365.1 DUF1972 domain-containing protein [Tenuifilaceae bacterium]HPV55651.1 DUF1972 domain-containing protein [Tenuifilaceae bacterium]
MQIAILGTRGIPNHYGGFERFAEVISAHFVGSGQTVYVLSPSILNRVEYTDNGVAIVSIKIARWLPKNLQTLLYDYKSLKWASRNNVDIVLECGYSFALWVMFFKQDFRNRIFTNPDGIEFKRKKWGFLAKQFLIVCERLSIKHSKAIVCDSPVLANYFEQKYKIKPNVIPYGAYAISEAPDRGILSEYKINSDYFLVVSRFTPENSLEQILSCFSQNRKQLLLVGNFKNRFGMKCYHKYRNYSNIKFLGGIYNQSHLNALRYYSKAYIHGHSVGGTNPSLLEAMACKSFVIAHNNDYNRFVLNNKGLYFSSETELDDCINKLDKMDNSSVEGVKRDCIDRVSSDFKWSSVSDEYIRIFNQLKTS